MEKQTTTAATTANEVFNANSMEAKAALLAQARQQAISTRNAAQKAADILPVFSTDKDAVLMVALITQNYTKPQYDRQTTNMFQKVVKAEKEAIEYVAAGQSNGQTLFAQKIKEGHEQVTYRRHVEKTKIEDLPVYVEKAVPFVASKPKNLGQVNMEMLTAIKARIEANPKYLSSKPFHIHLMFDGQILSTKAINEQGYKISDLMNKDKQSEIFGAIYRALKAVKDSSGLVAIDAKVKAAIEKVK